MEDKNYKQKLENVINKSELNNCDKGLWSLFMAIAPAEEDEAVYEAVMEGDDNLRLLTQHLQEKIFTMQNISKDSWQRLVENQEKFAAFLDGLCA